MKLLITKKFVLIFDSGVIVIKHWRINNYLRTDRYRETKYIEEKSTLTEDENGAYKSGIPNSGIPSIGKDSIDKFSLDQESIGKGDSKGDISAPPNKDVEEMIKRVHESCRRLGIAKG